jgi:hypothetical protein
MAIHDPSDDMAQEVERQLQLAIAAAALAARKAINLRRASLADAQADSEARAAELRDQLDRQRALAISRIQPVFDQVWWETATPSQVGEMWQEAAQWRQFATSERSGLSNIEVFDRAAERIDREGRDRWQVDVYDVAALAHADDLTEANELATANPAEVSQPAAVTAVPTGAEAYDTPARRERLQRRMVDAEVPADAVDARMLADTAQACPVSEAMRQEPTPTHPTRPSPPRSAGRRSQRGR